MGLPELDLELALSEGIIQEVNRKLLHPMGMALAVVESTEGPPRLVILNALEANTGEGMRFAEGVLSREKALNFHRLTMRLRYSRQASLGYSVQPLPEIDP